MSFAMANASCWYLMFWQLVEETAQPRRAQRLEDGNRGKDLSRAALRRRQTVLQPCAIALAHVAVSPQSVHDELECLAVLR